MDIYEFMIEQVKRFLLLFAEAKVRYGYDDLAKVHTIEVSPSSLFSDAFFQQWEGNIIEDFVRMNPTENICISPKDDVLGIGDVVYTGMGADYNPISLSEPAVTPVACKVVTFLGVYSDYNLENQENKGQATFNSSFLTGSLNLNSNNYPLAA